MAQTTKQYFKDYFRESKKIKDSFEIVDKRGTLHIFDKNQVLEEILAMPNEVRKKIRKKLVVIDFQNKNPNHFLEYILKGLVNL